MEPEFEIPRIGALAHLSREELDRLASVASGIRDLDGASLVSRRGTPLSESLLLLDGMMSRTIGDRNGERSRLVALQVPGDFVDLHSFPLHRLDHDVATLSAVRLAVFPHAALDELVAAAPELGRSLWGLTLIDASIHRHWAFRINAMRAMERIANFLAELAERMARSGRISGGAFDLPLTQTEIGGACGLSTVHVNRVLRDLREEGACTVRGGQVHLDDRERLNRLGSFDPYYLYPAEDQRIG